MSPIMNITTLHFTANIKKYIRKLHTVIPNLIVLVSASRQSVKLLVHPSIHTVKYTLVQHGRPEKQQH